MSIAMLPIVRESLALSHGRCPGFIYGGSGPTPQTPISLRSTGSFHRAMVLRDHSVSAKGATWLSALLVVLSGQKWEKYF